MNKLFDRNKWWPPLGISCVWLSQEWTESEAILGAALQKLVAHDRAAAMREGIDGCVELQHAERVLAFYAKTAKTAKMSPQEYLAKGA